MKRAHLAYGHGTFCAEDDASFLIKSILGIKGDSLDLSADYSRILTRAECNDLDRAFFYRIRQKVPTPYIAGESWLGGLQFKVTPNVLIPRSFIMECLGKGAEGAEAKAAKQFAAAMSKTKVRSILDVGTGSGCLAILLALAYPEARVHAVDICEDALDIAWENVQRHSLERRILLHESDLFSEFVENPYLQAQKSFQLIVSNPPYVDPAAMRRLPMEYRREPEKALAGGGEDGLDIVRRLLKEAPQYLAPNGVLLCEVGGRRKQLERSLPRSQRLEWLDVSGGNNQVFLCHRHWLC